VTEENIQKEIKDNIIETSSDTTVKVQENTIELDKAGIKQVVQYNPVYIIINYKDNKITITPKGKKKKFVSVSNTVRKLINNAIAGFDKEYTYKLSVVYSHFPITVKIEGDNIIINNFLGEKKPRKTKVAPGCKVEIKGKDITISGRDKYAVGQTAGSIESTARVTGKDYRVFDDGIYIIEKDVWFMPKIRKGQLNLLQKQKKLLNNIQEHEIIKLTEKKRMVINKRRKLLEEKVAPDKNYNFRILREGDKALLSTDNVVANVSFNQKESKIKVVFLEDKEFQNRAMGNLKYGNDKVLGGNAEHMYIYLHLEEIANKEKLENYEFRVYNMTKVYTGNFKVNK